MARAEWFAAGVISLGLFCLHVLFWRHAGGLWRDEANLINLAGSPSVAEMLHDSFPLLMPLLVKAWLLVGTSDHWLRFLGLLCGLAVPVMFWASARVNRKAPFIALTVFGLNETVVRYGDSLRAYGLGTALICGALMAMLYFLQRPAWSRAALLALAAVLSVQTLYQNALLFFAIALGGFAICWRRKDLRAAIKIVAAGSLAAVSLLPYWNHFKNLAGSSVQLRGQFSPALTWSSFAETTGFPMPQLCAVWCVLTMGVLVVAGLALFRRDGGPGRGEAERNVFAAATCLSVLALFAGFLWFAAVPVRPWYWLPPLALVALCFDVASPLAALPRAARLGVFGVMLGITLISIAAGSARLNAPFTNVDRVAECLKEKIAPGDFVIVSPWFCGITFQRYFGSEPPAPEGSASALPFRSADASARSGLPDSGTSWETLPPLPDHQTHRYDLVLTQMGNSNALAPVFQKAAAALRAGHRVWVAGSMALPTPRSTAPSPLPPPPLPRSGWSDWPYANAWAAQTAFFLSRHSARFEQVPHPPDNPEAVQEHLDLFLAEGWAE